VLVVHNEIHYVPLGEGWEEVVVRNVLHYVPLHPLSLAYWYIMYFMYRRPILCTLYGAVDFLNVLKKGFWGGGVLLVPNEIHYVPIGGICTNR
jgi:hypothetical protein